MITKTDITGSTQETPYSLRRWRWQAWSAVSIAGLFSLPPVILRGPMFEGMLPTQRIFDMSLIIHVNASVLFWLLATMFAMFSDRALLPTSQQTEGRTAYRCTTILYLVGLIGVVSAALFPGAYAIKNNYIPVLTHPVFFVSLAACALAVCINAFYAVLRIKHDITIPSSAAVLYAFLCACAGIGLIVADSLRVSAPAPDALPSDMLLYYERIFWGGGHLIVAAYSFLVAALWIRLADPQRRERILPIKIRVILSFIYSLHFFTCLYAVIIYVTDNNSGVFTYQMRVFGGLAPIAGACTALYLYMKHRKAVSAPASCALYASWVLFGGGGLLGYIISGENTSVPSHYHGSIVGITLAAMGYFFVTLPSAVKARFAAAALCVYAFGQMLHISGLYLMGGYGALRKEAHGTVDAAFSGKIMFFAGGGLALLGALSFSCLYFISEWRARKYCCAAKN